MRRSHGPVLLAYYLGSLPFILGLLFFWADMSRSPMAHKYVEAGSLGLAFLFIWMKIFQCLFAFRLQAEIQNRSDRPTRGRGWIRLIVVQTLIQASGLVVLPVSLVLVVPFGWCYAFYQNATVIGLEGTGLRTTVRKAWDQARLWPLENHLALSVMSLFGLFVFLNLAAALVMVPQLFKTLLGIETVFSRSVSLMLNSTLLAATLGMTYLLVDPIMKAVYVLRCFHGESRGSGLDLKVALSALKAAQFGSARIVFLLIVLAWCLVSIPAQASSQIPVKGANGASRVITAPLLEEKVKQVLERREFTWRMPRTPAPEEDKERGLLGGFLDWLAEKTRSAARTVSDWMKKLGQWLDDMIPDRDGLDERKSSNQGWFFSTNTLIYAALALVASILAVVLWRNWKQIKKSPGIKATALVLPKPDVRDEAVSAEVLPSQEWLAMAARLKAEGEFRLALRALFLATLAGLAEKDIVSLAKFKSNRDYFKELAKRFPAAPDVTTGFSELIRGVERVWYGRHPAGLKDVDGFSQKRTRLFSSVDALFDPTPTGTPDRA